MKALDEVVSRIHKLLNLANSPNEHEAKVAMTRANELLLKYNLNLQQIEDRVTEYETQEIASTGLTLKPHQKEIVNLLQGYFFVRIILQSRPKGFSSGRWGTPKLQTEKFIQLVGTKENCQIASYIYSYLNDLYPKLWKEYYDRNAKVEVSDRASYYKGLTYGIEKVLDESKFKVEQEMGLVVVRDPKLDQHIEERVKGTFSTSTSSNIDNDVVRDGYKDGKNVTLRKPIESTSTDSKRYIESKRDV